ncbi:MAG: type IV secretory system conjugative DNA transfer family protein [Bacilli bacterium]|nr:type IV secretory system conjugative DNA transfer family protein [Bacilli bacterium]
MKFRIDSKDMLIFLIFCLILLYIVAIGVLNISSFAQTGELYGLNPVEAFSSDYFAPTMVFYIAAIIGIMTSVSSLIFERENGFGLTTKKKDKGYSRWASESEMKKELKMVNPKSETAAFAGIPIINNGKKVWVDAGEYHNLIIGSTGSGKTEMIVQPMVKLLAKKGESMIITDPKGEIYENNAEELRQRGYNVVLLNFRDPQKGSAWNPLTLPYSLYKAGNKDKANELLDDLALNILYDEKAQNQDPFWEKTSADYFAGIALALFDDATEEQINLNSINLMTTVGEDRCGAGTYIKEYFLSKDPTSPAYINVASTINAPTDTKGSILSVFKQKIKLFSSRENISEMLSHSDFDLKDIGRKKTAVFLVIQDEKKTYHSLVTIFIKQCYETLIDVAQENGGKLAYKTNFILDEFANMPPLKDVTTMVTAARSRKIRFTFIIQNFAQLTQVYGKENGETIKGNCGNIIYLISSEIAALEEISKMCGEVKSKEKDKTASTPLVTVSDLQRMPKWSTILIRTRMMPFKTKMTPNWKMEKENLWERKYPKANYIEREKESVATFDLKAYVDEKRKSKQNEMLNMFGTGAGAGAGLNGKPSSNLFDSKVPGVPSVLSPKKEEKKADNINFDDLVKKIEGKIAEIEEEEKKEKEVKTEDSSLIKDKSIDDKEINSSMDLATDVSDKTTEMSEPILSSTEENNIDEIISEKDVAKSDETFTSDMVKINEEKNLIENKDVLTKNNKSENEIDKVSPLIKASDDEVINNDKKSITDNQVVTDDQFFDDFFGDE